MKIALTRNLGMLLLAVWLIVWGLSSFGLKFTGLEILLAILAIAAGVFILIGR
jgi:hypothetical protein